MNIMIIIISLECYYYYIETSLITWPLFRNYYFILLLMQISVVSVALALASVPRELALSVVVVSASNAYHNNLMVGR